MTQAGTKSSIIDVSDHLEELPVLPVVITRMLALNKNDDDYFENILRLAQEDPSFALRIVKMANSGAFKPLSPINDLNTAVARIGTHQVATLVTSMAVMQVFVPTEKDARTLWLHAIQTAVTARNLAQKYLSNRINSAEAYFCGLMHDIGRFILFDVAADDVRRIDETGWNTPEQLIDIEEKRLGINHAELGWHVCNKWMMPEHVCTVVQYHHTVDLNRVIQGDRRLIELIRLIQVSDHFSVVLLSCPEIESLKPHELADLLQTRVIDFSGKELSLSTRHLQNIMRDVIDESLEHCAALGLRIA